MVCKEPGLLTTSYDGDRNATAERLLTNYLRKGSNRAWIRAYTVHRLDRETSGLLIFAKSAAVQQHLKKARRTSRKHYAPPSCTGVSPRRAGRLPAIWRRTPTSSSIPLPSTRLARASGPRRNIGWSGKRGACLLDITLLTGLQEPDPRPSGRGRASHRRRCRAWKKGYRVARMALHARTLSFPHPHDGRLMAFEAEVPEVILGLVAPG